MDIQDTAYIGDGVYVGHDGYQLYLTIGSHENIKIIAIEPEVLNALNEYYDRIFGETI